MAALPYIQLFPADYLADTRHLTLAEHGAYLLLIFNYWQTGKPLRADDQRMASVCSTSVENWLEIKPVLTEFFVIEHDKDTENTLWRHPRIDFDLQKVLTKSEKASRAGKKSALQRIENKKKSNERTNRRTNYTDTDTNTDTKQITPKPPHGLNLEAWELFTKYRRENRIRKLKPASVAKQQAWLVEQGDQATQQAVVDQCIRQGWQGLHALKPDNGTTTNQSASARFMENLKNA